MILTLLKKLHIESTYVRSGLIYLADVVLSTFATFLTLFVTAFFVPNMQFTSHYFQLIFCSLILSALSFFAFKTYRIVIRHSLLRDIWKIGVAIIVKDILIFANLSIYGGMTYLREVGFCVIFDTLCCFCLLVTVRVAMILIYDTLIYSRLQHGDRTRTLIYGTNTKEVGQAIRLQSSSHYNILGFITYGKRMAHYEVADKKVYYFENEDDLNYVFDKYGVEAILFTNNIAAQDETDRLVKFCLQQKVKVLITPTIDEVGSNKTVTNATAVRNLKIEDLLGRDEIKISLNEIKENFRDKTVLVTGAAGSIGSELCRQLATFGIRHLVLFDNAETPMHTLRLELEDRFPDLKFTPVIGDVRLNSRLDYVFQRFHPQIVFHAAAYKHVPLMEENPCEAVLVNVAGSRNVANFCIRYDVERMVMISTDKAVNPTNIMGCTKRLAEIYVQSLGQAIANGKQHGRTQFITTRFGNVLGSNGSVIPRFREQIEKGGPVTVTHPEIRRYFMTIPEACRLVMEAATIGVGNSIFVFDMGQYVKIVDLAKRMIELSGYQVDKDIKITYTGLRPGEKLYEEVLSDSENTLPTSHEKIRIAKVREYDYDHANSSVDELEHYAKACDIPTVVRLMKHIVPEFKSKNSVFEQYDRELEQEQTTPRK
jgi:FlaA1/EpsC-like NDP-sugar epimerase